MKKLFLVIGAPGSGKTTDAEKIAENNQATTVHFSTGELLRERVATADEVGKQIKSFLDSGNLVPIDVVIQTIIDAIERAPKDIIVIDGYPRSLEQLHTLNDKLKETDQIKLAQVIEVDVSKETAVKRVLGRARGADDNAEVFENRWKIYTEPTQEIKKFYTQENLLTTISGEHSIEEVVADIDKVIKSK